MSFFRINELEKLSPEERKQFDALLSQFPQLRSKMETARDLNTGTQNPFDAPEGTATAFEDDGTIDYEALEQQQKQQEEKRAPGIPHLGAAKVDPTSDFMQPSVPPKEEERRQEEQRLKERSERREQPKQERRAPPKVEEPKFSTEGKLHPALLKARQALGMDVPETKSVLKIGDVEYHLRRLNRDEVIKATSLATLRSRTEAEIRGNIEAAIISFAIQDMDGAPLTQIFDIPFEDYNVVLKAKTPLADPERRERAAHKFFDFLKEAPNELNDTLIAFYEQEFPAFNLLSATNTNAYCPAANCVYRAIIGKKDTRFCPYHGEELLKEESLPNPF